MCSGPNVLLISNRISACPSLPLTCTRNFGSTGRVATIRSNGGLAGAVSPEPPELSSEEATGFELSPDAMNIPSPSSSSAPSRFLADGASGPVRGTSRLAYSRAPPRRNPPALTSGAEASLAASPTPSPARRSAGAIFGACASLRSSNSRPIPAPASPHWGLKVDGRPRKIVQVKSPTVNDCWPASTTPYSESLLLVFRLNPPGRGTVKSSSALSKPRSKVCASGNGAPIFQAPAVQVASWVASTRSLTVVLAPPVSKLGSVCVRTPALSTASRTSESAMGRSRSSAICTSWSAFGGAGFGKSGMRRAEGAPGGGARPRGEKPAESCEVAFHESDRPGLSAGPIPRSMATATSSFADGAPWSSPSPRSSVTTPTVSPASPSCTPMGVDAKSASTVTGPMPMDTFPGAEVGGTVIAPLPRSRCNSVAAALARAAACVWMVPAVKLPTSFASWSALCAKPVPAAAVGS